MSGIYPLDLSQGRDLVLQMTRDDHSIATPLIKLIRGLTPETGDPDLFALGDQLCRELILLTSEFEEFYSASRAVGRVVNLRR